MEDFQEFRSPSYRKTIVNAYSCSWICESGTAEHLWLRFLYESHRKGNWYLLRRNFPCLLVECMTEGELGHEVGGRKFLSRAGEVIVIPQVPSFRFFSPSPAESKRFAFEVQGALVPLLGERIGLCVPFVFRTERMGAYRALYDRCLELFRAKKAGTETEVSSLCFRLLEMLVSAAVRAVRAAGGSEDSGAIVRRVVPKRISRNSGKSSRSANRKRSWWRGDTGPAGFPYGMFMSAKGIWLLPASR